MRLSTLFIFAWTVAVASAIPAVTTRDSDITISQGDDDILPREAIVGVEVAPDGVAGCGFVETYRAGRKEPTHRYQLQAKMRWCYMVIGAVQKVSVEYGCTCWFHGYTNCAGPVTQKYTAGKVTVDRGLWHRHQGFTCQRTTAYRDLIAARNDENAAPPDTETFPPHGIINIAGEDAPPGKGNCGWYDFTNFPSSTYYMEQFNDRAGWCYKVGGLVQTIHVYRGCMCWFHDNPSCGGGPMIAYGHIDANVNLALQYKHQGFTCTKIT